MLTKAAIISSRLCFASTLSSHHNLLVMSAAASSSSSSAADRRVIPIDVVSDTWVYLQSVVMVHKLLWSRPCAYHITLRLTIPYLIISYHCYPFHISHYCRVWPWCYIGKKRLEIALDDAKTRYPQFDFDVRWRPFELNPNLPKGKGHDKMWVVFNTIESCCCWWWWCACWCMYDSYVDLLCMLSNIAHTHAISSLSKSDTYIGATMNPNLVRIWSVVWSHGCRPRPKNTV